MVLAHSWYLSLRRVASWHASWQNERLPLERDMVGRLLTDGVPVHNNERLLEPLVGVAPHPAIGHELADALPVVLADGGGDVPAAVSRVDYLEVAAAHAASTSHHAVLHLRSHAYAVAAGGQPPDLRGRLVDGSLLVHLL